MIVFHLLADVTLNPNAGQLPGEAVLQQLTNGIGGWALIAALIGMVIGAVAWAFGQHSQNYHQAYSGRKGVIISGAAALLIGAAPQVINFFTHVGNSVR
jgi:type IV secretory pathway VirB2 component (pilin)